MGFGKGVRIDISLIMKIIALVCCACALGLSLNGTGANGRVWATFNCFKFATGGYMIVLAIFIGWAIVKYDVDKLFAGCILAFGFIYNVGAGAALISYYVDYKDDILTCVGGALDLAAGIVMLVDTLHCFGLF
ncbi:uncharacterized protein LOC115878748 [Sitophilus oryzae]|uniref:Uncharacterized protein LOC115878748 n=1 Tax=Sitophilus oryzae TaxID=7048 RepID=A0A6J2XIB8_SITOR|nr:uncharacterized protein LOC115878748 [Sitophilus oryzae]